MTKELDKMVRAKKRWLLGKNGRNIQDLKALNVTELRPKTTWLEVDNKDLKELAIYKVDVLGRIEWKQLICKGSAW